MEVLVMVAAEVVAAEAAAGAAAVVGAFYRRLETVAVACHRRETGLAMRAAVAVAALGMDRERVTEAAAAEVEEAAAVVAVAAAEVEVEVEAAEVEATEVVAVGNCRLATEVETEGMAAAVAMVAVTHPLRRPMAEAATWATTPKGPPFRHPRPPEEMASKIRICISPMGSGLISAAFRIPPLPLSARHAFNST